MENFTSAFSQLGTSIIANFSSWSNQVFSSLKIENPYLLALDIIITAIIVYWFLVKIVETRAVRVLYGLAVLFLLYGISQILGLNTLNFLLRYLGLAILIAVPIIFHPEIRAALERLGGGGIKRLWGANKEDKRVWAQEISKAAFEISKNRTGGLIVIESKTPLVEYAQKGVRMGGEISSSLLESIFSQSSDLKDGAVIISRGEIAAAKAILPVSRTTNLSASFGARHLAGVNITEETDALAIIISSNGRVSVAWQGKIRQAEPKQITKILKEFWGIK